MRPCTILFAAAALWCPTHLAAQDFASGYRNHGALTASLDRLARDYRNLVRVSDVAVSPGGRTVRAVRLAVGEDADERPALLLIANAYGPHLVGSEIALNVAARLAAAYGTDDAVTGLLDSRTIYIIPRANPDAAEAFFQAPLVERLRNEGASEDDDHDWRTDEDGPEDLNGDGLITMMRVRMPGGDWIADEANSQLMRRADAGQGEVGEFRLYLEGTDNDGDEEWNEDLPGGTDVNANFSYGYDYFATGSGIHQMSSPEARGIAEFVVEHLNIAAVYVLGPQDNLVSPWKHKDGRGIAGNAEGTSSGGPFSSILEDDETYFAHIAERFSELTGLEEGPESAPLHGDALSWSYFHMGRWAFGSRVWWVPDTPADSGEAEVEEAESLADEYNAYRWIAGNIPGGFVEWTAVDHPDFPGVEVEVGGFVPFVLINPPAALLDSISTAQTAFVAELMESLPSVELRRVTVEQLGPRTFRVEAELSNGGYLPTLSAIGVRAFWPRRIRLTLETDGQEIAGGRAVQLVGPIEGSGGDREFSWVVVGGPGSRVTVTASSPVAGTVSQTVVLR